MRVVPEAGLEIVDLRTVLFDLLEYLVDDPECSLEVEHFVVVVVLRLHESDAFLQQFDLPLFEPQLVLVLPDILHEFEVLPAAPTLLGVLTLLQFLLQPLDLLPGH